MSSNNLRRGAQQLAKRKAAKSHDSENPILKFHVRIGNDAEHTWSKNMMHVARAHIGKNKEEFWFVSFDGDHFREVSREPTAEDEAELRPMFNLTPNRTTNPMKVARRFLDHMGATFSTVG